jgi:hypothetical protein
MALGMVVGVIMGVVATIATFYLAARSLRDTRVGHIPFGWSSADQKWDEFAIWLRQGGRRLLRDAAFAAAQDGMSEQEVRATFGPPDFVIAGAEELKGHPQLRLRGAEGAYLYKIGRFVDLSGPISSEVFAIVFDSSGRVVHRLGFGVQESDTLANIDVDTRSDHKVVAK